MHDRGIKKTSSIAPKHDFSFVNSAIITNSRKFPGNPLHNAEF